MAVTVSHFTTGLEGWTVVDATGAPATPPASWIAPATGSTDGAVRYVPPTGLGTWSFAAPAAFAGDRSTLLGGSIDFVLELSPDARPMFPSSPASLVLQAGTVRLGIDALSAGAVSAGSSSTSFRVHVPVSATAGWRDLATATAATDAQLQTVLAGLRGFSIAGAPAAASAWTQLRAVAFNADPRRMLLLDVTAFYEDRQLHATWAPVESADAYHVEVRDPSGVVYQADLAAASFIPPVTLASAQFTARAATDYDVRAWLVGLASPAQRVHTVDLNALTLSSTPLANGVRLVWTTDPNAAVYELQVQLADGTPVLAPPGSSASSFDATTQAGLSLDVAYRARVRARTVSSLGPWSAPFAFKLASARAILTALRDRLVAHRTADAGSTPPTFAYTFDAATFPPGLFEHADDAQLALQAALGGPIALHAATEPVLSTDGTSLTLAGTATLLGVTNAPCTFTAAVSDAFRLHGTVTLALPDTWSFGETYPVLINDIPDALAFRAAAFTATSTAGLSFSGTTDVPSDLFPRLTPVPAQMQAITLAGAVTTDAHGNPSFTLTASAPAAPLTFERTDQSALTLSAGIITLSTAPTADGSANASAFRAIGTVSLGTLPLAATLELPHRLAGALTLRVAPNAVYPSFASVTDVLELTGTPARIRAALHTIATLASPAVSELSVTFDPAGTGPTSTVLSLAVPGAPWTLSREPRIDVGNFTLKLTVTRFADTGRVRVTFLAEAGGTITLANTPYAVSIKLPSVGPAVLVVTDEQRIPTLQTIAQLAGFKGSDVLDALPGPLSALGEISVAQVAFDVELTQLRLARVFITFAQTKPWPIATGAVTLTGWTADVTVTRGTPGWSPRGVIRGTVMLGSAPDAVSLTTRIALPIDASTQQWTLGLADGEVVHVPTMGELLGVLGVSTAALPVGLTSLGGLDVTRFEIAFDANARSITQLAFAARQSGGWTIIPGALTVTDLDIAFALQPGAPVRGLGSLSGILTIAAQPLDVSMIKNDFASDWLLEAGYNHPAHVPGFAALDAWLSPGAAGAYLPSNLPLAQGLDLWNVRLTFDGTSGALKRLAFLVAVSDLWTIVPDKLSITDVHADLAMPYPVDASKVTGDLAGTVKIGDAVVRLVAAKPSATKPWTFTGALTESVSINLLAAANALSTTAFMLPGDIVSYGLLPSSLTLKTANVRAVPDTGYFRFMGSATFTDWTVGYGAASLRIEELGGELLVKASGAPVRARLQGRLGIAGVFADVFVQLGTAAPVDTIILGLVSAEQIPKLSLAQAVDATVGTGVWANAPTPQGFAPPGLASAAVYLNLTQGVLALFGRTATSTGGAPYGAAGLLVRRLSPASGSDVSAPPPPTYGYAFVLNIEGPFHFAALVPSDLRAPFEALDALLQLQQVSLAISSFDQTSGTANPLADLSAVAAASKELDTLDGSTFGTPVVPFATRVSRGLNIYGELVFQGPLWEAVRFVLGLTDARLKIQAAIDQSDPAKTLFRGELTNVTLLSVLHFDRLTVKYRPHAPPPPATPPPAGTTPTPDLSVGGAGELRLPGVAATIGFTGWATFVTTANTSGQSASAATLTAMLTASVDSLFGIPNVSLRLKSIDLAWDMSGERTGWTLKTFNVVASATAFGLTLNALVDLSASTRRHIRLALDAGKSLGLKSLVSGVGATWAEGLMPDLSFSNGWLDYVGDDGGSKYTLHAEASIVSQGFVFEAVLTQNAGVTGTAALANPIDFGVLRLSGPDKVGGPKASLSYNATAKSLALDSVVTLLDHDITLHLTYVSGVKATYGGSVTTTIDLGSVLGSITPTVHVVYEEDGKVEVSLKDFDLPWATLKKVVNFLHLVQTLSKADGDFCGALGDLGLGPDAIQCELKPRLAFPKLAPATGGGPTRIDIGLTVAMTIKIDVPGIYQGVVHRAELSLDFLKVDVPTGGLTFAKVGEALGTALFNAGPTLVGSFFKDGQAMTTFAEILVAKAITKQARNALLCRGVKTPKLKDAKGTGKDAADKGEAEAESSLAKGAQEAAKGAFADAVTAFSAAFVIAGTVVSFLNSIWDSLTGEDKKKKERAEAQQNRALKALANMARPSSASLAYAGGHKLIASCVPPTSIPEGEGATYVLTLTHRDGTVIRQTQVDWTQGAPAPSLTVEDSGIVAGGTYVLTVVVKVLLINLAFPGSVPGAVHLQPIGMGGIFNREGESDPVTATREVPNFTPTALSLEQVGTQVSVRFDAGPTVVDHFELTWLDRTGADLANAPKPACPHVASQAADAHHVLRIASPIAAGDLRVRVRAILGTGATAVAQDAISPPLHVLALPAPVLLPTTLEATPYGVRGTWSAAAGAAGYRLQLLDMAAVPVELAQLDTGSALTATLPLGILAGVQTQLRVASLDATGLGAVWSEMVPLPIPGAVVTISLAAVAADAPTPVPSLELRQELPPPAVGVAPQTLAPGETRRVSEAAVAAFSLSRTVELVQGFSLVQRLYYVCQDVRPTVTLTGRLTPDGPDGAAPDGVKLTRDWGLRSTGGGMAWSADHPPTRMALWMVAATSSLTAQVATALAVDQHLPGAGQLTALLAFARDPVSVVVAVAANARAPAETLDLANSAFAALGQPLDPSTQALALVAAYPQINKGALADILAAERGIAAGPLEPFILACRTMGLTMTEAATHAHTARPTASALTLAMALVAAYDNAALASDYAAALASGGIPALVAGRRVKALGATPAEAGPALVAAYGPPAGSQVQLAAALLEAGVAPDIISAAVADAFALTGTARTTAIAHLDQTFRPSGGDAVMAALAQAVGTPLDAVRANRAALAPLSADARTAALARTYPGLASQPDLLAAALSLSGATEAETTATLLAIIPGVDAARAAQAWSVGHVIAADLT